MKAFLYLITFISCTAFGQNINFINVPTQFCYDQKAYIHFKAEGSFKGEEFILYRKNFDLSSTELGRSSGDSILITPTFSSYIFIESSKTKVTSNTITMNVDAYTGPFIKYGTESICTGYTNKIEIYTGFISGDEFAWYRNDSLIQSAKDAIYLASKSGTYTAKVKRKNCIYNAGGIAKIIVGQIKKPALSTAHRPEICDGFAVEIKATVPNISDLKYQWFYENDTLQDANKSNFQAVKTGNYRLILSQGKCKSTSDDFVVRIGNLRASEILTEPVPAIDGVLTVCEGLNAVLKIGDYQTRNDMNIYWLKNGVIDTTLNNLKNINAKGDATYRYILRQGECKVLSKPLIIKTGAIRGFNLNSSAGTNACEGQTINASVASRNNTLINSTFNINLYQDGKVLSNIPYIFDNLRISKSGNYHIEANYVNEKCRIYSDTLSVLIAKSIIPFELNKGINEIQACADSTVIGNSFSLTGINASEVKFDWTLNGKALENKNQKSITVKQDGVYSLKVAIDTACVYQSKPLSVKLKTFQAEAINIDPLCAENITELSVQLGTDKIRIQDQYGASLLGNEFNYQWFQNGDSLGQNKKQSIKSSGNYKAQVRLFECRTETKELPVQLLEINKTLRPMMDTLEICPKGGIVKITAAGIADTYEWINDGYRLNANDFFINATSFGIYRVWMEKNGCAVFSDARTIIKSDKKPTASISGSKKIELGNETEVKIDLTASGPWTFLLSNGENITTNETPYIWNVSPIQNSVYAITTVSNPCGSGETFGTVDIEIFVLGNELEPIGQLSVYPNPTADKIKIELNKNTSLTASYKLFNIHGSLLKEISSNAKLVEMDISSLPVGSYVLKVISGDEVMSRRLVKRN
jgi:hypothetical protein